MRKLTFRSSCAWIRGRHGLSIDGTFDAITCFNVLEHIADDQAVVRRFAELLAPDGTICIIVPAHPLLFGPLDEAFGHERRYTSNEMRRKLRATTLEPETIQHVNAVGAIGWLVQSRILRKTTLPRAGLSIYDHLVPILRSLDRIPLTIGLSLWVVAKSGRIDRVDTTTT